MKRRSIIPVIVLLALAAVYFVERENFHEVTADEIYRSAQLSAARLKGLVDEHHIKTVISLRIPDPGESWYDDEIAISKSLGITHIDVPFDFNFEPRIDLLIELRDLIETAPRPILLHCKAGVDRTGLASVMVKLMDETSSLEEARAQVSWRYHALSDDSEGIPFFNAYASWLEENNKTHSKDNFMTWLEKHYAGRSGNIHYLVDAIEGQLWMRPWGQIEEGREFLVDRKETEFLELSGWAFDTRNVSLLDSVEAYLGGVRFAQTSYGIMQPWLIDDFGKQEYLASGWTASHPLQELQDGCHELVLKFNRLNGSSWTSPPTARICVF